MSAIFISHSARDKTIALQVLGRLRERGYQTLFLDSDPESGIKAGADWERELYRSLKLAGAVVVLCSPDSMASRWCFAEIAQAKALAKKLFPVVVVRPCEVIGLLAGPQVIDFAARGEDEGFRRLFDGLRAAGLDPADSFNWDLARPPYPGLLYFDTVDAGIYFGRGDKIDLVRAKLNRMRHHGEPRLLVVVGSSGSGKSSLVRAGVVPRLDKDRSHWAIVPPFRPMSDPIGELARALAEAFPEGHGRRDWTALRDRLKAEAASAPATPALAEIAHELVMALGRREASVLLVVDQAEELIQNAPSDEALAFLAALRNTTDRPGGRVFVLLTLRSDFLGSFQNHPGLRDVPFADVPLGLLPVERFAEVIEGPAARAGIALEPGLVHAMTADARTDDALPLLAFTLEKMYEQCGEQARFTLKVYRDDLGGIQGAVARVVERIKADGTWTSDVNLALRRAFLKLVWVNDDGQYTRQRARWADLPDQAVPVLEKIVKARLLTSHGDMVEVAHESLFRRTVWPELADWLDESRKLMLWRKSIQGEVTDWASHGQAPDRLLSGARVAEARHWLKESADDFLHPETEFLAASIAAEDERVLRERVQQQKLRRLARGLAIATGVASILVVIALGIGRYAFDQQAVAVGERDVAKKARAEAIVQRDEAKKARAEAIVQRDEAKKARNKAELEERRTRDLLARSLYAQVAQSWAADPGLALSLLDDEQAFPRNQRDFAWRYFHRLCATSHVLQETAGSVYSVSFSRDGAILASAGHLGLELWDVGSRARRLVVEGTGSPQTMAVDWRGGRIAVDHYYATIRVVDAATGRTVATLKGHRSQPTSLSFSPDGTKLASGDAGKRIILWDMTTLAPANSWEAEGRVRSLAFSPDGSTLAIGGDQEAIWMWDVASGHRRATLEGHKGPVHAVCFSPDGRTLVSGGEDETLRSWDVASGTGKVLATHRGPVLSAAFSKDGSMLASAGRDQIIRVWEVATGRLQLTLRGHGHPVDCLDFNDRGTSLASGGGLPGWGYNPERALRLWDLRKKPRYQPVHRLPPGKIVRGLGFGSDGTTLAAAYNDNTILLVDAPAGDVKSVLQGHAGVIRALAVSPDGKTLATAGEAKSVCVWDIETGKLKKKFEGVVENAITSIAFQDNRILGCGTSRMPPDVPNAIPLPLGRIVLLDVRDGRVEQRLDSPGDNSVYALAFSPDASLVAGGTRGSNEHTQQYVYVWDVSSGDIVATLREPKGGIYALGFSPDGGNLVAGIYDKTALIWSSRDWGLRARLDGHSGPVTSVVYSPEGGTLATGCEDGLIRLWSPATGELKAAFEGSGQEVHSLAFSHDGRYLASGGGVDSPQGSAEILLWEASSAARR